MEFSYPRWNQGHTRRGVWGVWFVCCLFVCSPGAYTRACCAWSQHHCVAGEAPTPHLGRQLVGRCRCRILVMSLYCQVHGASSTLRGEGSCIVRPRQTQAAFTTNIAASHQTPPTGLCLIDNAKIDFFSFYMPNAESHLSAVKANWKKPIFL